MGKRRVVVNITAGKPGKNENWVVFEAYIGVLGVNTKYKIDFCGTELHTSASLLDAEVNELREQLIPHFGFPPYDMKTVNDKLKDAHSFTLG